jgi:hypothetical protein
VIWLVLGTIGVVSATIVAGVLVDRKWGLLPRPAELLAPRALPGHAPGEAPATALAAGAMEIEKLRRNRRCRRCKGALDGLADDAVAYDGKQLTVLQFRCPRCEDKTFVYISPPIP